MFANNNLKCKKLEKINKDYLDLRFKINRLQAKQATRRSRTKHFKYYNENEAIHNPNLFTDLPNEIIGNIMDLLSFKDLFNLEMVNKRMRDISLKVGWPRRNTLDKESFKYGLNLVDKIHYKNQFSEKNESILSRTNIKYLDISAFSKIFTENICFHIHLAPHLIKLNLSNIKLKNDHLAIINCNLLENVSLNNCLNEDGNYDESLKFFFKKCLNLKRLEVEKVIFSGECFSYISINLQYLNLRDVQGLTSNVMQILSIRVQNLETLILEDFNPTADVNNWLKRLTKLRFINISWVDIENLPALDFSDQHELEMLSLASNKLVTNETLKSLQNCPKLKGLDLSVNVRLNQTSLNELKNCKALKYCDFSHMENLNNHVVDLVRTCKLEYLAINECEGFPENVLKSLVTDCDSLLRLEVFNTNISEILSLARSEKNIQRSNILKILVVFKCGEVYPTCNWCEFLYPKMYGSLFPKYHQSITQAIRYNNTIL